MVRSLHLHLWVWSNCGFLYCRIGPGLVHLWYAEEQSLPLHRRSGNAGFIQTNSGRSCLTAWAYFPLNLFQWKLLAEYPEIYFKSFNLEGVHTGFRIGFNRHSILELETNNMNPEVPSIVSKYLQREVTLARMMKLPPYFQHPAIHISPLGIVPKKNKPGKWRLIVDLSSLTNTSVNENSYPHFCMSQWIIYLH